MANTITQTTLEGAGKDTRIKRAIHIVSDGTEETALVVFDNSAFCADTSKGRLMKLTAMGDACNIRLEWDQTANSSILSIDPQSAVELDFTDFGGFRNPNAAGATGDILLVSADLDAGDEVTLIIDVKQA